jgi:hypothetical protein
MILRNVKAVLMLGLQPESSLYLLSYKDSVSYGIKSVVFRGVTPYTPLGWLNKDGGNRFLRNVGNYRTSQRHIPERCEHFGFRTFIRNAKRISERGGEDSPWIDFHPAEADGAQHLPHAPLQMATNLITPFCTFNPKHQVRFL